MLNSRELTQRQHLGRAQPRLNDGHSATQCVASQESNPSTTHSSSLLFEEIFPAEAVKVGTSCAGSMLNIKFWYYESSSN